MNIYQRIVLILGAIALFIFLWITFTPIGETTYDITLPVLFTLLRAAGIIVITLFIFFVLKGIGKKEGK